MRITLLILFSMFFLALSGQESKNITLPTPDKTGGMPLMQALNERKTQRDFDSEKELSDQQLSDLLWAASGINRPESGKRTAPTAMDDQEIEIYVNLKGGSYLYDYKNHTLTFITGGDNRKDMGRQGFVGDAAVVLVFVVDYSKMSVALGKDLKDFYSATDVGYISQNVYLFAASERLASVVLGWIDRDKIIKTLNLTKDMKPLLSQCVGWPK
jgi:hypothetical protein